LKRCCNCGRQDTRGFTRVSTVAIRKRQIIRLEGIQPWICRKGFGCEAGPLAFLTRPRLTVV